MFCDAYNKPLSDAALGGALTARLKEHLAACACCRAAFAEEQELYASIDSGLRVIANTEAPSTLVPRVQVAINNEPIHEKTPRIWVYAAAPLVAASLLTLVYLHSRSTPYRPATTQNASNPTSTVAAVSGAVNTSTPRGVNKVQGDGTASVRRSDNSGARLVEVIVEPEEGAALLRYEARLRERSVPKPQTLLASTVELPSGIQPLEIAALEVGDLRIPALSKTDADGDMK